MSKDSTVVIGCKLPTGIKLEIGTIGEPGHRFIILKGANEGALRADGLFLPQTIGGFGRTEVPADFWEAFKNGVGLIGIPSREQTESQALALAKANRKALVAEWQEKGVVFVAENPDFALAQANEKAAVKTGFEPNDPNKLPGEMKADQEALDARKRENFGAVAA